MEPPLDQVMVADLDIVEAELDEGLPWGVQFDRTPGETVFVMGFDEEGALSEKESQSVATKPYFERLNRLCERFGPRLSVRFYGHYGDVFDARVLEQLPDIQSLIVNCIEEARNLDAIARLGKLTHLSLGVRKLMDKSILYRLPIARLHSLVLEEADTKALDLAPVAAGLNLKTLKVFGHRKNIADLGDLSALEEFVFNPAKDVPLSFINGMSGLVALKLVLGGTEHLRDITLPALRELAVTRTRGLQDLGDLQRFATLERILVQDEPHLMKINTGSGNRALRHIWLHSCPNLTEFGGLADLPALLSLHATKTGLPTLDLDHLPATVTHIPVEVSGSRGSKRNGLIQGDHPDMPFFYK